MKAIVIFVTSIVLFVSVGGRVVDSQEASPSPMQRYELAGSSEEIAGSWYSFPVGTAIRFNRDGRATFGLDETGGKIGYDAHAWFEGHQLFIQFTDYAGDDESCRTAAGVYEVQQLEDGQIKFAPQQDACEWRANVLNGHPDLGFDLIFHPVE